MSFPSFMAELTIGWAMSHPLPFFAGLGLAGVGGTLAAAAAILRRDDMPLTRADQETVDLFATMPREVPPEARHGRHVPRHARPRPPVPALVAGRAATWTLAALTDRLHAAQAAPLALPAPTNVPGREPGDKPSPTPDGAPVAVHAPRDGDPGDPAGDTPESIWPHDTGWYSAAAIEAAVTAGGA